MRSAALCDGGRQANAGATAGQTTDQENTTAGMASAGQTTERDIPTAGMASAGQTPQQESSTAGIAPGSPTRLTCNEVNTLAGQEIWSLVDQADRGCAQDEDCVLVSVTISCSSECPHAFLSRSAQADVQAGIVELERSRCDNLGGSAPCEVALHRACAAGPSRTVPRCKDGRCDYSLAGCDPGCIVGDDGLCHGLESCDGCPYVLDEIHGKPCDKPGLVCHGGYPHCQVKATCSALLAGDAHHWFSTTCGP